MAQQYKFFYVPARNAEEVEEELNHFCKTVRVVNVRQEFTGGDQASWCVAVEYLTDDGTGYGRGGRKKRKSVDYREILSPEEFAIYAKLRDWRKETSEKEGLPMYVIFTNEQMAQMARRRVGCATDLKEIDGVGDARIEKYGETVVRIIQDAGGGKEGKGDETGGAALRSDSGDGKPEAGLPEGGQGQKEKKGGDPVQLQF